MAATALPAAKPRGTVTPELVSLHNEMFGEGGFMETYCIERREQLDLLGVSLLAGIDPLFIGHPGVGKTWMIELLMMCLEGTSPADFFNTMVFKETPADDVLGPRSLPAMKDGRIERLMEGFLPTSIVAYLDEIFKASPTFVNALLDILAQRKLKVGKDVHDVGQIISIIGSSNELPDREDMWPFRDRWAITNFVPAVKTPEGRRAVLDIQDNYKAEGRTIDLTDAPRLSLMDVAKMRQEVDRIIVPDHAKEVIIACQEQWDQKDISPSTRRVGAIQDAMKGLAWMRGDGEVHTDDIIIAQHMAWNEPDDQKAAREIVMQFANAFARKANQVREALDPTLAELDKVRKAIGETGPNDELDGRMFEVMKQLREIKRTIKENIDQGEAQGHSVRDLEDVQAEVNRASSWVEKTMLGEDTD